MTSYTLSRISDAILAYTERAQPTDENDQGEHYYADWDIGYLEVDVLTEQNSTERGGIECYVVYARISVYVTVDNPLHGERQCSRPLYEVNYLDIERVDEDGQVTPITLPIDVLEKQLN